MSERSCEEGSVRIGRRVVRDHHGYGDLSFREVIAKSSNVGTVKVAELLGEEALYEAVLAFGFGRSGYFSLSRLISASPFS